MISCIFALLTFLSIPVAVGVVGASPDRVWSSIRHPFETAHNIGVWFMERYLALEPLSDTEHAASVCAIPLIFGFAIWLNFQP